MPRKLIARLTGVVLGCLLAVPACAQGLPCRFDERFPVYDSDVQIAGSGFLFTLGEEPGMRLEAAPGSPYFEEIRDIIWKGPENGAYDALTALVQFGLYGPEKLCGVVPSLVSYGKVLSVTRDGPDWSIRQADEVTGAERVLRLTPESKCSGEGSDWVRSMVGKEVLFPITTSGYILHCSM